MRREEVEAYGCPVPLNRDDVGDGLVARDRHRWTQRVAARLVPIMLTAWPRLSHGASDRYLFVCPL